MILNGECGSFNPLLLECLLDISDHIQEELAINSLNRVSEREINTIIEQLLSHKDISSSNRTLSMLEEERIKFQFFASLSSEIQFEYTVVPSMITLSDWGAERLGISRTIINPEKNQELLSIIDSKVLCALGRKLQSADPSSPDVEYETQLIIDGIPRTSRIICRTLWTHTAAPEYSGAIGKIVYSMAEEQETASSSAE